MTTRQDRPQNRHGPAGHLATLLLGVVVCLFAPSTARAQEFRLAPLDQVALRVLDWNPVAETVRGWTDISGEYHLDENGNLHIPFVGQIDAAGRTLDEAGNLISEALRERFALGEAPDATLDFTGIRTVVVGGYVRAPGPIEFMPGLSVRHAIALAGGLEDVLSPGKSAFRDYIADQGQLKILTDQKQRKLAILARLKAERAEVDEITVPQELANPDGQALIAEQAEIMQRRRARLTSEREALGDQEDLLVAEIDSLTQKIAALERQRELAQEARANAQSLADRGLVNNERLISAENRLISIENQLLDTSTAILRARQGVSATKRELDSLVSGWKSDVIDEIQTADADAAEIRARITTLLHLLDDGAARLALLDGEPLTDEQIIPDAVVTIYRPGPEGQPALDADLDHALRPGDLVDVQLGDMARQSKQAETDTTH